jgi:mRNA interferase RelE/StbE
MELIYRIQYHALVVRQDIPKLSATAKVRIQAAIEEKLSSRPDAFGIPLRRSLKGLRKLRVGDYRVIFRIHNDSILIFAIIHRSIVYTQVKERI